MSDELNPPCPLLGFHQLLGGKYKLRILWILSEGAARYGAINRALVLACQNKPVTPRILSRELKDLTSRGLIFRREFPGVPPKVEYRLTAAGESVVPLLHVIFEWGRSRHGAAVLTKFVN